MALINLNLFDWNLTAMLQQHEGGVEQFLGTIFSFLACKTDFYTATSVADAKKVIFKHFQKYGADAMKAEERQAKYLEKVDNNDDQEDKMDNDQAQPSSDSDADSVSRIELPNYECTQTSLETEIQWRFKGYGFTPRFSHAAVAIDDVIFSFGGLNYYGHSTYSRDSLDVSVLDVNDTRTTMTWNLVSIANNNNILPSQRWGHSAVAHKTSVIVFGGWDRCTNEYLNSVHCFNTNTSTWTDVIVNGNIPEARSYHASVVVGKDMMVFGGEGSGLPRDVYSLDLDTFCWSRIETKGISPSNRWNHSAAVYKDKFVFLFGGYFERSEYFSDLFCFDINSKEWSQPVTSGTAPLGRWGHSTFVYNGLVYIFGGFNLTSLNDLFSFNPETFEWKEVKPIGEPPSPRSQFGCVALGDRVFFFGGWNYLERYLDDTFVLEIGSKEIERTVPGQESIHETPNSIPGPSSAMEMNTGVDLHDRVLNVAHSFTTSSQDRIQPNKRKSSRVQDKSDSKGNRNRKHDSSSEDDGSEEESKEKMRRLYGGFIYTNPVTHRVKIESDDIPPTVEDEPNE